MTGTLSVGTSDGKERPHEQASGVIGDAAVLSHSESCRMGHIVDIRSSRSSLQTPECGNRKGALRKGIYLRPASASLVRSWSYTQRIGRPHQPAIRLSGTRPMNTLISSPSTWAVSSTAPSEHLPEAADSHREFRDGALRSYVLSRANRVPVIRCC